MSLATSLEGKLLIAMPGITDANFEKSVVFVCAHSEQGAMGFVVNKPAPLTVFTDLLEKTNMAKRLDEIPVEITGIPIRLGGPVETFRGFVLHSNDYPGDEMSMKAGKSFTVTATLDILTAIASGKGPQRHMIALGYAGWSPGQLENEILHNGWLHCDADNDLIFGADLDRKHAKALAKIGVDPSMLSADAGHA
jgi:putative transcriptional regulator